MFVKLRIPHIPMCAIEFNKSLVNFSSLLRIIILNKIEAVVALSVCTLATFCKLKTYIY